MSIEEELWGRLEQAVNLDISGEESLYTAEKYISMWLASKGHPLTPWTEAFDGSFNRLDFLLEAMVLQKNVVRGHRQFMRNAGRPMTYPARQLTHFRTHEPEPCWLQDRWEIAVAKVGIDGACRSPRIALADHPVWPELSEIGRPFEPLFPITGTVHSTDMRPISFREWRDIFPDAPKPNIDPDFIRPWENSGRISREEWMDIFRARLKLRGL